MSVGQIAGAVVGGVIGFYVGGPYGMFVGASIGYSLGTIIDPLTPDVKTPGVPAQPFSVTSNEIGTTVPDGLGTLKITGHLLAYGNERTEPITERQGGGGKGGGDTKEGIVGYRYTASWVLGICIGPVDCLYTLYKDEKRIWDGEVLIAEAVAGKVEVDIEDFGTMHFYFGTDDQVANDDVGDLIENEELNSPFRGLCWAFFDNCYIGEFNRLPTMTFVLRKTPAIDFSADHVIREMDYNPAHAKWYILTQLGNLPETWLHEEDFAAEAAGLLSEERGISILFDQQQSVSTYLENVNSHVDAILRYENDSKFHPKLIRDDYDEGDLLLVDESVLLDEPIVTRKSWIDTINELDVQYSEIRRDIIDGDFYPYCMTTDGAYLFLAGYGVKDGDYYLRVERRSMVGELLDYHEEQSGWPSVWRGIAVDEDYVYLAGMALKYGTSGYCAGIVQKRKRYKLSNQEWHYTWEGGAGPQTQNYTFLDIGLDPTSGDPCVNGDDTIGVGSYAKRIDKDDGSVTWEIYAAGGAGRSIACGRDYIYLGKRSGDVEAIEYLDGSHYATWADPGNGSQKCRSWINLYLNEEVFAVGSNAPQNPAYEAGPSSYAKKAGGWKTTYGPDPAIPTELNRFDGLCCDDFNLYVVGFSPVFPDEGCRVAKYLMDDGSELWGRDLDTATRRAVAICCFGIYIYVAGWDSSKAHVLFIERRSKSDGRIL